MLFSKAEQRLPPRRRLGQTIHAEIKVRMGKLPDVFDEKLEKALVHGGDGPGLCMESRYT